MVSHLANERCQVLDTLFLSAGTLASDASAHEWTAEGQGETNEGQAEVVDFNGRHVLLASVEWELVHGQPFQIQSRFAPQPV